MTFWQSVKKLYTDNDQDRNIYPFNLTRFSIEEVKVGCQDSFMSGNHSGQCLGDCCIWCIPVSIVIDLALCVPFGLYCMSDMCLKGKGKSKGTIKIQTVDPVKIQIQEGEAYIDVQPST